VETEGAKLKSMILRERMDCRSAGEDCVVMGEGAMEGDAGRKGKGVMAGSLEVRVLRLYGCVVEDAEALVDETTALLEGRVTVLEDTTDETPAALLERWTEDEELNEYIDDDAVIFKAAKELVALNVAKLMATLPLA
jgi:hypothetical protein